MSITVSRFETCMICGNWSRPKKQDEDGNIICQSNSLCVDQVKRNASKQLPRIEQTSNTLGKWLTLRRGENNDAL